MTDANANSGQSLTRRDVKLLDIVIKGYILISYHGRKPKYKTMRC